jgi:hypothetical protein
MIPLKPMIGAALMLAGAPLLAQTASPSQAPVRPLAEYPGPGHESPRAAEISAQTAPETAMANARAEADIPASPVGIDEAQYARDLAGYRAAVLARRHVMAQDAAIEARRERAYAMAMADWRAQVAACERGKSRACKAPSPDPAAYMDQ